jgi:transcriptional regulator with XRE-family HTH domain
MRVGVVVTEYRNSLPQSQALLYPVRIDFLYDSHMDIKHQIAHWVKDSRIAAELSQEQLGARLSDELGDSGRGYTKGNVSHWELERHQPSLQQLLAIAKITRKQLPPDILKALGSAPQLVEAAPQAESGPSAQDVSELVANFVMIKSRTEWESVMNSAKVAAKRAKRGSAGGKTASDEG